VTFFATDECDNTEDCEQLITVEDQKAPTPYCLGEVVTTLNEDGIAEIWASDFDNGSYDACGIKSLVVDTTTFDCSNIGVNTVTLTVTDNNDNVATQTATVTVEDNVAPTAITQDITVELDASGNASIVPSDIDNGSTVSCEPISLSISQSDFTSFVTDA
jgi:hypothetical protein